MIRFYHYLRGYLKIKIWGFSPERFINLCGNQDILLWDIENHEDYFIMFISIAGFKKLKTITKKTGTRVVILKKYGLPFFYPKIRKRCVFAIGLFGCLLLLQMMSHYIWIISFSGNQIITDEQLLMYLKEKQIYCGVNKKKIQVEQLERDFRHDFNKITWISAKIEGTKLFIQLKENDYLKREEKEQVDTGMDLQATRDGTIISMITRSGVPMVRAMDEIKSGDILISGAVPVYEEDMTVKNYIFCKADADIYLKCRYLYAGKIHEMYQYKVYTGREKKVPFLKTREREIKLSLREPSFIHSDCLMHQNKIELIKDFYLPLSYGNYQYKEYVLMEKKYTKEQVEKLCYKKLEDISETLQEKGVQILEKNVKIKKESANYLWTAEFLVIEKTGKLIRTQTEAPNTDQQ